MLCGFSGLFNLSQFEPAVFEKTQFIINWRHLSQTGSNVFYHPFFLRFERAQSMIFFQIYLLVTRVSLHPFVLVAAVSERVFATISTLVESLKAAFFLTSCQPNWPLVISQALIDKIGVVQVSAYPFHVNNSTEVIFYHHRVMDKSLVCSVIALLATHCNFVALTFFTMTTVVRFYIIVVSGAPPSSGEAGITRRALATHAASVAMVYLAACGCTLLTFKDYSNFSFSKACMRPHDESLLSLNAYGAGFYACCVLQNVIVMVLNISLIIKLIKSTSASHPVNESMV